VVALELPADRDRAQGAESVISENKFVVTQENLAKRKKTILKIWKKRYLAKEQVKASKHVVPSGTTSPYDAPISYLRREIYRTVRACLRTGGMEFLQNGFNEAIEALPIRGAVRPTSENKANPFYVGVAYITAEESTFSRNYRMRFSRELLYAHLHDVPPDLLIGFLYQIGSSDEIGNRLKNCTFEEWNGKLPLSTTAKELKRIKHQLAPASKPRKSKK
jgi:hypothetical protein